MKNDIGGGITAIGAFITLVVEFYFVDQIIAAFRSVVPGLLPGLLFGLIALTTFVVFITDLLDIAGIDVRG
jgi:hypothetical protein